VSRDEIKRAVKEAIREELSEFGLDARTHRQHHDFIETLCDNLTTARKTFVRVVVRSITLFIIGAITFFLWPKK